MVRLVRVSFIVAAAIVAVSSTAALAQPASNDAIIINAPQKANLETNQLAVRFNDLALNRPSGQTALMHRVGYAIETLCQDGVASSNPVGAMKCSNVAWDSVRPQLAELLKR